VTSTQAFAVRSCLSDACDDRPGIESPFSATVPEKKCLVRFGGNSGIAPSLGVGTTSRGFGVSIGLLTTTGRRSGRARAWRQDGARRRWLCALVVPKGSPGGGPSPLERRPGLNDHWLKEGVLWAHQANLHKLTSQSVLPSF